MKKIVLILAALLIVCAFSALAEDGELIEQGVIPGLPGVFVTPTPTPRVVL